MRLHWKLMLTYILLIIAVMAFVHVYLERAMRNFLISHMGDTLEREVRLAANIWERSMPSDSSFKAADALADDLGRELALRATFINGSGKVLGDSKVGLDSIPFMENHGNRSEVLQAREAHFGRRLRYSATLKQEMLYVARLISRSGGGSSVMRLAMPLREVEDLLGKVKNVLWIASGLGLGLALLLVYGASRMASRPIVQMTRGARQVAAGEVGEKIEIPISSTRELADLGTALQKMYRQTQERIGQITTEKVRLEAILDSITEGILVTGKDGRAVLVNHALLKIFSHEAPAGGFPPVELIRNEKISEAIVQVTKGATALSHEITLRGIPERNLDVQIAPVLQGGECIGAVAVFYEITALRRLERMRKDFVANVSHELRTPLTAIKGYAETLADGALKDHVAAERFVQIMAAHADRLTRLLDDLLDLSHLESEKLEVELKVWNLLRLVEAGTNSVSQIAQQKNISLRVDVPEDLEVNCDPELIEQALVNLIDNALKYTPEGGAVDIRARPHIGDGVASSLALEIKDTGIGIPHADLGRIFERFYRVDKGRSRAQGGTGLGLSIVRHIIEAHGEQVFVESELGKGSTFGFTLPAV